jgi:hypothetical protein
MPDFDDAVTFFEGPDGLDFGNDQTASTDDKDIAVIGQESDDSASRDDKDIAVIEAEDSAGDDSASRDDKDIGIIDPSQRDTDEGSGNKGETPAKGGGGKGSPDPFDQVLKEIAGGIGLVGKVLDILKPKPATKKEPVTPTPKPDQAMTPPDRRPPPDVDHIPINVPTGGKPSGKPPAAMPASTAIESATLDRVNAALRRLRAQADAE